MRTLIHRVALMLAFCTWCDLLPANDVSFLQSPLGGAEGLFSDPAADEEADNFSFAEKTKVNSLRWWGTYFTSVPESDHFTIRFFSHQTSTGRPEISHSSQFTSLVVSRSNSGLVDFYGDTIYQYQAPLTSPVVFAAGSTFYLSVLNSTVDGWFWQKSTDSGSNWFRLDNQEPWIPITNGNLAFELIGVTQPLGDYDGDFDVDSSDYNSWRQTFGNTGVLPADGNANAKIDAADYVIWRKSIVKRPGDFDGDNDVDSNDYNTWRQTFGNAGALPADGNANGKVDAADYVIWRKHLGQSVGASASLTVPEPTSIAIIAIGALLGFPRSSRRKMS